MHNENEVIPVNEVEKMVTRHDEQIRTLFKQVAENHSLLQSVQDLALSVRDLANAQAQMRGDIAELQEDVGEIKQKPAKRWDGLVEKLIYAVVAAVAGFMLAKFGL